MSYVPDRYRDVCDDDSEDEEEERKAVVSHESYFCDFEKIQEVLIF